MLLLERGCVETVIELKLYIGALAQGNRVVLCREKAVDYFSGRGVPRRAIPPPCGSRPTAAPCWRAGRHSSAAACRYVRRRIFRHPNGRPSAPGGWVRIALEPASRRRATGAARQLLRPGR